MRVPPVFAVLALLPLIALGAGPKRKLEPGRERSARTAFNFRCKARKGMITSALPRPGNWRICAASTGRALRSTM